MSEPQGVSIIVVSYNNERFLAAAIDSALGQDYPLCEVIAIDAARRELSSDRPLVRPDRIRASRSEWAPNRCAELRLAGSTSSYLDIPRLG